MSTEQAVIRYLNTDLDLRSAEDLTPLAEALGRAGVRSMDVNCSDRTWWAMLETTECRENPDATISYMLDAIENMPPDATSIWQNCSSREFNIGYDCGDTPWGFTNAISNHTLMRIANAGASLGITIYPATREESAT